ncbi:DUF3047 domain-containing protein [Aquincola sp. S2]|uniref:DUF3047 domain-containing protein n=1 Tax=Pseudaquabacterium terrae TaxID=2732868 RepID=A0ABX2EHB9_9BURK|nr:DUF3047 domain-containing protein [Aquabacterium terrae]NRF68030.1 DUF3047 domain-containing protein [Aquabacterium terrae]
MPPQYPPIGESDRHPGARRALFGQLIGLGALGLGACAQRGAPLPQAGAVATPDALPDSIAPFSSATPGARPPAGWQPYVLRKDKPPTRYNVVRDNDRMVLHARAEAGATGLRCPVRIDPHQHSRLQFSWRVQQVPSLASVDVPEHDDAPARIILAFDGDPARLSLRDRLIFDQVELFTGQRLPFATLMYVWCAKLPPESVVRNHRSSRIHYLTVESGAQRAGRWLHYERDVVADYRRVYGEAPGMISSVGVLTDSDALKHEQQAWYGDIVLRRPGRT